MTKIHEISNILLGWYRLHKRELPWRDDRDPYKIWLSEIILQQTRVQQGLPYYWAFIHKFPTIKALASADLAEVYNLWQGLGYYSRANNLHKTAKIIASQYNGLFPHSYPDLLKLPGIGPYTAAAIASMAFGLKYPAMDGNFFRVVGRLFEVDEQSNSTTGKKLYHKLGELLLEGVDSADLNQAIMDFASARCTPTAPNCDSCPLISHCQAFLNGSVNKYPLKTIKNPKKVQYLYFFYTENKIWIRHRNKNTIWNNLFEFPNFISSDPIDISNKYLQVKLYEKDLLIELDGNPHYLKHHLTHITFHIYILKIFSNFAMDKLWKTNGFFVINPKDYKNYAFPKPLVDFITNHLYHV
ncbi:MAG: A/G-specific adenine glycosylase [Saprospiraceae bacterium]|nr:A/G-specific adenine glycosylase [Saprospiraceae bacterium]